jgi:hypothetical protein
MKTVVISRSLAATLLAVALFACLDEHYAVVSTAAGAEEPWNCPEDKTTVTEVSYGRYRLHGCGADAVYECNFAFQPPRCWRP